MTGIEWTEETWNPVTGCDRISPGCDNCYALTLAARLKAMGQPKYQRDGDPGTSGPGFGLSCHREELTRPLRWRRPRLVFVNSMSDLFHRDLVVPVLNGDQPGPGFVWRVFQAMAATPRHTFQVLTKRPDLAHRWFTEGPAPAAWWPTTQPGSGEWPLANVWLGTSIELARYLFRADHVRATPAAVRWLSLEPLLGPVPGLDLAGIDWVVVGAESGHRARPTNPEWVRDVRDQCAAARGAPVRQTTHRRPPRRHRRHRPVPARLAGPAMAHHMTAQRHAPAQQLALWPAAAVDVLLGAGIDERRAVGLVAKWERWGLDPGHEAARHAAALTAIVAECPFCGLTWSQTTPVSWWLRYDRCYACARHALGLADRCPTDHEMAPFKQKAAP